jgi:hypothetical protein
LLKYLNLKENGSTDNPMRFWTGDLLVDHVVGDALKMTIERVEGREYLFVEEGGFGPGKKEGWKPRLYVMVRTR